MTSAAKSRRSGFALIEALIALILILVGLVAVSKLQTVSLIGSGESKARAEAANLAQEQFEQLRNQLTKADYTANVVNGSRNHNGVNANFALAWTVTDLATPDLKQVQIAVTWTDARGAQRLDLNSQIAWDDVATTAGVLGPAKTSTLIAPTGEAQRGGELPGGLTPTMENHDGTKIFEGPDGTTYLTDADDNVILFIPPKNSSPQQFTTITGRVYFDLNAGNNALPDSEDVRVRLSSEGECIFDNTALEPESGGSNSYEYFTYTCYVGPGWYGNVGVTIEDDNGSGPKICVGDPGFNGGVSNSTQTSAHPSESGVRTYRGFRSGAGTYLSTGMMGGRRYGLSYVSAGVEATGPFDGRHRPSDYGSFYGNPAAGSANDYLNQDFLLTKANPSTSCASKMAGGVFARNAGKYVCINPDAITGENDVCPSVWPNFESEIGNGGSINFTLDVITAGNGGGTVSSSNGSIACPGTCSASFATGTSVTLTATADGSSAFAGWSGGGCSGTGTCIVTMSSGQSVTATFDPTTPPTGPFNLTVTKAGLGTGTVASTTPGIDCGSTCTFSYNAGVSVTLNATPTGGSTFGGWSGGGCSGTGSCTVLMNAAQNVTATFVGAVCTTPISGSAHDKNGTVTANPGSYGTCNMAGGNSSNYSCSFNAPAGTPITLTNSRSAGNNSYSYTLGIVANCVAQTNVNFPQ